MVSKNEGRINRMRRATPTRRVGIWDGLETGAEVDLE